MANVKEEYPREYLNRLRNNSDITLAKACEITSFKDYAKFENGTKDKSIEDTVKAFLALAPELHVTPQDLMLYEFDYQVGRIAFNKIIQEDEGE